VSRLVLCVHIVNVRCCSFSTVVTKSVIISIIIIIIAVVVVVVVVVVIAIAFHNVINERVVESTLEKKTVNNKCCSTVGSSIRPNNILRFAYCRKFDIVGSVLQKLEKYADNLENIVQQRTAELMDEKQKTDMLLHRMLPP